jgi:predicted dehydrogenase
MGPMKNPAMVTLNRRRFLMTGAAGALGAKAALGPAPAKAAVVGANDRVRVGVIGTGRQGLGVLRGHRALPDAEIAAICDVFEPNLAKAAEEAPGAARHADFRRILDDKSIDAVVIATPDHWHALMTVMACQAGKDVYVEKPTSVAIGEGRKMVQAARKYERIVQVGTQQRSQPHFRKVAELVRGGRIGAVTSVRCWNVSNNAPNGIGTPADSAPPAGLDWDLWLGPAPSVPFNPNRFGVAPDVWSYFRWFWDYAGGMMTDWGVHLIDIVHWAMDVDAPLSVSAVGGKFALSDNRETPDTLVAVYRYPKFTLSYENRVCNAQLMNGKAYGIEFYGTDATLFVDRAGFEIRPESRREGEVVTPRTTALSEASVPFGEFPSHPRNFIDCVKARRMPICDIETGHRSSSAAILGNLAYRSGSTVEWDAKTEMVTNGNAKAAALVDRPYRAPWKLEV